MGYCNNLVDREADGEKTAGAIVTKTALEITVTSSKTNLVDGMATIGVTAAAMAGS